ncbi:unnamed protein product [Symbiodinium sp. KB8]|nr:unnamed protein product [Symbiodinium sp. KB8]
MAPQAFARLRVLVTNATQEHTPQPEKEIKDERHDAPWLIGEAVAFDESGEPIILRQVDPESGRARHVVRNADGSLHTFGDRTIESLMCSEDTKARRWLAQLSSRDVRGLVHTLGHRLLQSSQLYQQQHVQLVNCADSADYHFFGLCPDCSEHDLDLAYRKMAKQLHPDKNGGTEYAKRRFQNMKDHGMAGVQRFTGREDPEGAEDNGRIEFDPADRSSLDQTVWKMLHQLRTLKEGLQAGTPKDARVNGKASPLLQGSQVSIRCLRLSAVPARYSAMTRMQRRCVAFVLGVQDEVLRHAKLGLEILAAACRKSPMFKEEDVHVHSVQPGSAKRSKVKVLRDLEDKVAEVFDSLEDDAIVLAFYIGHGSLTLEGYTNVHDLHFQLEPRLLSQAVTTSHRRLTIVTLPFCCRRKVSDPPSWPDIQPLLQEFGQNQMGEFFPFQMCADGYEILDCLVAEVAMARLLCRPPANLQSLFRKFRDDVRTYTWKHIEPQSAFFNHAEIIWLHENPTSPPRQILPESAVDAGARAVLLARHFHELSMERIHKLHELDDVDQVLVRIDQVLGGIDLVLCTLEPLFRLRGASWLTNLEVQLAAVQTGSLQEACGVLWAVAEQPDITGEEVDATQSWTNISPECMDELYMSIRTWKDFPETLDAIPVLMGLMNFLTMDDGDRDEAQRRVLIDSTNWLASQIGLEFNLPHRRALDCRHLAHAYFHEPVKPVTA